MKPTIKLPASSIMSTSILHEDSPDLTPLAADVPDPLGESSTSTPRLKGTNGSAAGATTSGAADDISGSGGVRGFANGDEDEDMDEMGSEDEADGDEYERERARIIQYVSDAVSRLL